MAPLKEMVLYYDPNQSPYAAKLKGVLVRMGVRIKNIAPEQVGEVVGVLAGFSGFEKEAGSLKKEEGMQKAECAQGKVLEKPQCEMSEEMLVMKNFTGRRIDELLINLRKAGVPKINLKAVITEQNSHWTFSHLYEEIQKEHLAMTAPREKSESISEEQKG